MGGFSLEGTLGGPTEAAEKLLSTFIAPQDSGEGPWFFAMCVTLGFQIHEADIYSPAQKQLISARGACFPP